MSVTPLHAEIGQGNLVASVIEQLRNAAVFLATEGVKVSPFAEAAIRYFAASTAEVNEIAAAIGNIAEWDETGTQYSVKHEFGHEVAYSAVYIRRDTEPDDAPVPVQPAGRAAA